MLLIFPTEKIVFAFKFVLTSAKQKCILRAYSHQAKVARKMFAFSLAQCEWVLMLIGQ